MYIYVCIFDLATWRSDAPLEIRKGTIKKTWLGLKVLISGGMVTYPPKYPGGVRDQCKYNRYNYIQR